MKKAIMLAVLLLGVFMSHAQFQICNSNTDNTLHDVYFFDESTGIAVGDYGLVLRSTDGGLNWFAVFQLDSVSFLNVEFWDKNHGIVQGDELLLTTVDAGDHWTVLTTGESRFLDIQLLGSDKAIVSNANGELLKLSNYGMEIERIYQDTSGVLFKHMSFVDQLTGFAHYQDGAIARLFRTVDGGYSWTEVESTTGMSFTIIEDIKFLSEDVGFRGGWYSPVLEKTLDNGTNWVQTSKVNQTNDFWSSIYDFHIEPSLSNTYFSCGWYGEAFRSTDDGDSWQLLETPVSSSLRSVYFINDSIGWVVGEDGVILKTTNGGGHVAVNDAQIDVPTVFPNPTNNGVSLENINLEQVRSLNLFNPNGQLVRELEVSSWLSFETLTSGIYYLHVDTQTDMLIFKLTKL